MVICLMFNDIFPEKVKLTQYNTRSVKTLAIRETLKEKLFQEIGLESVPQC